MPLGGWTCDEIAALYELSHRSKATQAFDPAVTKVAWAMLADPQKTFAAIHEAMALLTRDPDRVGRRDISFDAERYRQTNRSPLTR